ncbi:hypothetical protein QJS66_18240 [Kocuria rhizophila]|nr:hypothetical protein QJS66_18240 [Kocuria rhizophila]
MEIDPPRRRSTWRRAVDRLTMEELALDGERPRLRQRLAALRQDKADRQAELDAPNARWESEKAGLQPGGRAQGRIDDLRRRPSAPSAATSARPPARHGEIPAAQKELDAAQARGTSGLARTRLVSEEVTADDIARSSPRGRASPR